MATLDQGALQSMGGVILGNDVASAMDAVRQLHYVKEHAGGVVAAHVENVNEAMVRAGDGSVLQEAAIFPFERRPVGKSIAPHNLDAVIISQFIAAEPHF